MSSPNKIKSITIFCGSSIGKPVYQKAAEILVDCISHANINLVYGGAKVGLMGIVADRTLKNNGKIIGVIPKALQHVEVVHTGLTELHLVETMHERKALMYELSDGFIMLSGACGTLDEFFEMVTWGQLHIHSKPCAILNVNGYYDNLLIQLDHMIEEGFLKKIFRDIIIFDDNPENLLQKMLCYQPPFEKKWAGTISDNQSLI